MVFPFSEKFNFFIHISFKVKEEYMNLETDILQKSHSILFIVIF